MTDVATSSKALRASSLDSIVLLDSGIVGPFGPATVAQAGSWRDELVPQQATFAPSLERTPQWQLPVPESWMEPPCAGRKRQV